MSGNNNLSSECSTHAPCSIGSVTKFVAFCPSDVITLARSRDQRKSHFYILFVFLKVMITNKNKKFTSKVFYTFNFKATTIHCEPTIHCVVSLFRNSARNSECVSRGYVVESMLASKTSRKFKNVLNFPCFSSYVIFLYVKIIYCRTMTWNILFTILFGTFIFIMFL